MITGTAFVDLSAAYDTVNRILLIQTLLNITQDGTLCRVIQNLLSNRRFYVELNNERSRWFQRLQPARGGTAQRKIFLLANWSHLIHPGPSSSRSRFFMESSQSCAATLTHYSIEPLTPGPDYDPLLLLLALAGDVHPNPGPSRYPCSVCFKNVTSQGTSYLCTFKMFWSSKRCGLS